MNARRCALRIFRGIGFLFGIQKSLQAFLNPFFTGGVVTENGSCAPPIKNTKSGSLRAVRFFVFTGGDTP
ncbi:hypothetical protein DW855_07765 [Faecalibacterium prausnitzii]|uniref:Uncharacterized protein n=1 Tax=Faecalibacterium prausnitzii TaxID=853 RepID=A0A3E2W676_9FIRM|nr:hypothetical protein DW855_07765 [Faecalibacterium prausnitzii]